MQSNVTQERVPIHGDPGHWIHISQSPRHVRVMFGGVTVASSKRAKLVREAEVLPAYYFPKEDVRADLARVEAEIADLTSPEKVSWGGQSEALRRFRVDREELRQELATLEAAA